MKDQDFPEFALSIRNPWAWCIFNLGKDVENRTWRTDFLGRVAIHVGKALDTGAYYDLAEEGYSLPPIFDLPIGAYVGEATITNCVPADSIESDWACGPWCFLLADPLPYADPIPGPGRLGFYRPDWLALLTKLEMVER